MISNKGVSEIISTILIMLVVVIVVGIILGGLLPEISRSKEKINFDNSKVVRDKLYSEIIEVYNSPIGATKEVSFSLNNLTLNINGDTDTIEIYSIINNFELYKDKLRIAEDNSKYTYRDGQKLIAGVVFNNVDIVRSYVITNQENAKIILKKIATDKIQIQMENETGIDPNIDRNYIYTGE